MRYQNPQLLYALFAIAIPILIHLFNFRKHKIIYFSSLRFLKEIKEDNQKKSKLRNILILLSRVLAITCLVLAFAKPYIASNTLQKNSTDIFIYIDNSFSMDAKNENGRLLALAKQKAKHIYESYPQESSFWLITNDFAKQHSKSITTSTLSKEITEINSSPAHKSISQIINRSNVLSEKNKHLYIISDMQISTLKAEGLQKLDTNTSIFLVPIPTNTTSNISIDSCWINTPILKAQQELEIFAKITNTATEEVLNKAVFLEINEQQKSQQFINLKKEESKTISFKYLVKKSEIQQGTIKINDYPFTFDNTLYFSFKKAKKIIVTCINSSAESIAFNTLFGKDTSLFNFTNTDVKAINYNQLKQQDFIILNEIHDISSGLINTLNTFVFYGGSILIIPPENADLATYNLALKEFNIPSLNPLNKSKQELSKINTKHSLYKNVFDGKLDKINFPTIEQYYPIKQHTRSKGIALLSLENNTSFLEVFPQQKGLIYLLCSPLSTAYTNFKKHSLFVPTFLNMATGSIQIDALYYSIGSQDYFTSNISVAKTDIFHLKNEITDIIPTPKIQLGKQMFYTHNQIIKNGIYRLERDNITLDAIAYNYAPVESKTTNYNNTELKTWIRNSGLKNLQIVEGSNTVLKNLLKTNHKGSELWKIALLLSLLFFAIEILLIKLIKS